MKRSYPCCSDCIAYHGPTSSCRSDTPQLVADKDSPWVIQNVEHLPKEIKLGPTDVVPLGDYGTVVRAAEFAVWPRVQPTDWCRWWAQEDGHV